VTSLLWTWVSAEPAADFAALLAVALLNVFAAADAARGPVLSLFQRTRIQVQTSPDPEYRTKLKQITKILSRLGPRESSPPTMNSVPVPSSAAAVLHSSQRPDLHGRH
jgi:hypothetical protein